CRREQERGESGKLNEGRKFSPVVYSQLSTFNSIPVPFFPLRQPPQYGRTSQLAMAAVPKTGEHSRNALRVRLPLLPLHIHQHTCALGRAAKAPAFQAGQAGSIPAGHSLSKMGTGSELPRIFTSKSGSREVPVPFFDTTSTLHSRGSASGRLPDF